MRRLLVNTFLTLDGVMQAPGGPEEDPTGGFTHGGWSVNYWDEGMEQVMGESLAKPFDLLLGRKTYEIFAAHWPHVPDDDPAGKALNGARKYVASRTLTRADWQNSTLLSGDVAEQVAALKRQEGPEIQVHGSSNLLQTLIRSDLVDRFCLWVFPVVVGAGKRLFAEGTVPRGLKLTDSRRMAKGVVMSTYEPAGAIQHGSFALAQPTEAELQRRRNL